ncbi:MAG: ABC transporter ATP-binding protein [Lentisphaeria bacterium]|nr:ABC transporter ATP-binding protein [Lentisphaeria bacterium]
MTPSNTHSEDLLVVQDLRVTYRGLRGSVLAVDGLSLSIAAGEAVGLVGESGSGKSTAGLAVMGLLPSRNAVVTGSVRFRGEELLTVSPEKMRGLRGDSIGMVFQDPMTSLNPYLTVGAQVMETPVAHGMSKSAARSLALNLMETMNIPAAQDAFHRFPHHYSGGMRQRAMTASAFSGDPALLIADEPTTALDVITQDKVLRLMKEELKRRGMALLLITHDLGIVAGLCDRVVVMKDGRGVETAPVERLFTRPVHDYTKRLLAAVPRVDTPMPAATDQPGAVGGGPAAGHGEKPTARPVVEIKNLTVEFTSGKNVVRAVDDVSLSIFPGEILGLVGESGSGKSTLARAVAGLITPVRGTVEVLGRPVRPRDRRALKEARRHAQLVFQDPRGSLNGRLPVEAIISEPLRNFGLARGKQLLERTRELLDIVRLPGDWATRYPHELSGGQCQRVGIARALAVNPDVLLCDEPVSALDVSIQADVLDLLKDLQERLALTIVFISHDLAVVRQFADRVAVMCEGHIVELKPAAALYATAEHPYTRDLLAAVPIPDPTKYRL